MPYSAALTDVQKNLGTVVGSGQWVALVQTLTRAPLTNLWNKGTKVKGDVTLAAGRQLRLLARRENTRINWMILPHAAIYISQSVVGIDVYDQWAVQPAHRRTIRFRNGHGSAVNDGNQFYVIA